jgi:hypothetical protein
MDLAGYLNDNAGRGSQPVFRIPVAVTLIVQNEEYEHTQLTHIHPTPRRRIKCLLRPFAYSRLSVYCIFALQPRCPYYSFN